MRWGIVVNVDGCHGVSGDVTNIFSVVPFVVFGHLNHELPPHKGTDGKAVNDERSVSQEPIFCLQSCESVVHAAKHLLTGDFLLQQ